jgi:predicted nucleic acid-binding protein
MTAVIAREWPVAVITPDTIDLAFEGVERFGFSWYDAQIWAAAKLAGCSIVLSEDFCDGMCADGVRFVNPFAPDFDTNGFIERLSA